jgi:hypothetical protein
MTDARVWTLLVDPSLKEAPYPFGAFQRTLVNEEEILALFQSINDKTDEPLSDEKLKRAFGLVWPDFQNAMNEAVNAVEGNVEAAPATGQPDTEFDLLASLRRIENAIANLTPRPNPLKLASALLDWQAGQIPLSNSDKSNKQFADVMMALARGETPSDRPVSLRELMASTLKSEASSSDPNIAKKGSS